MPNLIYIVKFHDGSVAEYSSSENVLELAPVSTALMIQSKLLPYWIKGGCTVTIFLENMPQPRHGRLYEENADPGYFVLEIYLCCQKLSLYLIFRRIVKTY
jgi:hypothetical protein